MELLLIFLIIMGIFWLPAICYILFGCFKWWYHDILKWHKPKEGTIERDSVCTWAVCKYCGERIQQDSQGNWF